jgi:hypothetical protein
MSDERIDAVDPSVDLAYPLAVASYDWAQKRFDSVDGRIQTLIAFITTITFGVPLLASSITSQKANFQSRWFIAALIAFIVSLGFGLFGRLKGELTLLSPKHLYEKWLDHSEFEFKKSLIGWAGEHFEKNRAEINSKWFYAKLSGTAFMLESILLLVWVSV